MHNLMSVPFLRLLHANSEYLASNMSDTPKTANSRVWGIAHIGYNSSNKRHLAKLNNGMYIFYYI